MNHKIVSFCALVTSGAVFAGLPYKIDSTFFTLQDERIHTPVRIGVIADCGSALPKVWQRTEMD